MNERKESIDCGQVREVIPDYVAGTLEAKARAGVAAHVSTCDDCRAELDVVRLVFATRASAPAELVGRIERAAKVDRRGPAHTWWGVSAAAIAALALGIGITSSGGPTLTTDVPGYAYEAEEGEIWVSDDGLVAGAPALEDLSDEALLQLLDELTAGAGGAA